MAPLGVLTAGWGSSNKNDERINKIRRSNKRFQLHFGAKSINQENYQIKSNSLGFYQDLEHIDGIGISAVSANLYENKKRDELVIFYFRK